tara:strand:+ start:1318 stop:1659 length:342 start_codon:yes stop_codon:yes gene_type:complete
MYKKIEKEIQLFTQGLGIIQRQEFVHGTLYVVLNDNKDCDFFHKELRTFYRKFISPIGGVNMYCLGDEFCFDFVPEEDEAPVFNDKDYTGKEDMMPSDVDIALNLEAENMRGK